MPPQTRCPTGKGQAFWRTARHKIDDDSNQRCESVSCWAKAHLIERVVEVAAQFEDRIWAIRSLVDAVIDALVCVHLICLRTVVRGLEVGDFVVALHQEHVGLHGNGRAYLAAGNMAPSHLA